jgi:hypothetical protein
VCDAFEQAEGPNVTLTAFGRIEVDPARVPTTRAGAASRERADGRGGFDERLHEAIGQDEGSARVDSRGFDRDTVEPGTDADESAAAPTEPAPKAAAAAANDGHARDARHVGAASETDGDGRTPVVGRGLETSAADAEHDEHSVGASVRTAKRFTSQSGKGAGVPTDPSLGAATADSAQLAAAGSGAALGIAPSAAPVAGAAAATIDGPAPITGARANDAAGRGKDASGSLERPQAGYRTATKAALQLDAAARDSVFRQIAMRLEKDGGQMRLLLDPAEFGELDIKFRIEGKTLQLTIVTERPELATELQRDLAGLRDAAAAQGLEIGQAEIHAREDAPEGRDPSGWDDQLDREFGAARRLRDAEDGEREAAPVAHRHLITADRLDFWA